MGLKRFKGHGVGVRRQVRELTLAMALETRSWWSGLGLQRTH